MTMTDPVASLVNANRVYRVTHAGKTHEPVRYADVPELLAKLTKESPGIPDVAELDGTDATCSTVIVQSAPAKAPVAPVAASSPVAPAYTPATAVRGVEGGVDERGRARSQADFDAAAQAGFAPAQSVYTRGTRVIDVGIANARQFRAEYDAKELIGDACDALIEQVNAEQRRDLPARKTAVRLDAKGMIAVDASRPDDPRIAIEERAFKSLVQRLGLPQGAAPYLAACWPELRGRNVNQWQQKAADAERFDAEKAHAAGKVFEPDMLNLRTRMANGERVAYGVVSDGYTEFDADKLARAVKLALPPEARAEIRYDGFKAKISALFHSTVNPEDYVAGEFFRAGIVVRTDDTGGGSVTGYAVLEQNLCLNLYILSKKAQPIFRARHIGDPVKLAAKIREGLKKGEADLAHFLKAWGYARRDDIAAAAKERGELYEGMSMTAVFAALANGAIERELVPVRGRRTETVSELISAWERDKSADGPRAGTVTRAGLTNAFTRWAHESGTSDEFFADEVQVASSALLWPQDSRITTPPAIPAIPLDF